MLDQAVVDAAALRDAAIKNAESVILEKYSAEVKKTMDTILEQPEEDELGLTLDVGDEPTEQDNLAKDLPMAATDGESLCACPDADEEVEIDFDELAQAMEDEEEPLEDLESLSEQDEGQYVEVPSYLATDLHMYHYGMGDPIYQVGSLAHAGKPVPVESLDDAIGNLESFIDKVDEEDREDLENLIMQLQEILMQSGYYEGREDDYVKPHIAEGDDLEDITEEAIDEILESLTVDYQNVPNGWDTGATEAQKKEAVETALAAAQDDQVKEETEELNNALEKIRVLKEELEKSQKQVKTLDVAYNNIKSIAENASQKLEEMSVKNARLYYTNRVLKSNSLNEQQKNKIVEAISKVDSVDKAKIAFETLQETLKENKVPRNEPKSLNEIVSKKNHVLSINKQQKKSEDPWKRRQQELAGIKN